MKSLILFYVMVFPICVNGQIEKSLDSLVSSYHAAGLFNGVALVADAKGIVFQKGFGNANHAYGIKNTPKTIFNIGSLSKPFTAIIILKLIEEGLLSFETRISDVLPDYRKDVGQRVTIHHLLTHTSGIPSYTALPNVWNDSMQLSYNSSYILQKFCSNDLEFEPGTKYAYGNSGYYILAMIIERVTQKSLSEVLREKITSTLGMNSTGIDDNTTPVKNKSRGYYRIADVYIDEPYIYNLNLIGASGIHTTAADLYLLDRALYGTLLLKPKSIEMITSLKHSVNKSYGYGYGWEFETVHLGEKDSVMVMQHSGAVRAFRAILFRIVSESKCIVLLSNSSDESAYAIFEGMMSIFRNRPWTKPKKILADTLYQILTRVSVGKMKDYYNEKIKKDPELAPLRLMQLEFLGERLMLLRRFRQAIEVFQLAVDDNSEYANGFYYLGRCYERLNETDKAITHYKIAAAKSEGPRPKADALFQVRYLERLKK